MSSSDRPRYARARAVLNILAYTLGAGDYDELHATIKRQG
jgi:hypothetical protein